MLAVPHHVADRAGAGLTSSPTLAGLDRRRPRRARARLTVLMPAIDLRRAARGGGGARACPAREDRLGLAARLGAGAAGGGRCSSTAWAMHLLPRLAPHAPLLAAVLAGTTGTLRRAGVHVPVDDADQPGVARDRRAARASTACSASRVDVPGHRPRADPHHVARRPAAGAVAAGADLVRADGRGRARRPRRAAGGVRGQRADRGRLPRRAVLRRRPARRLRRSACWSTSCAPGPAWSTATPPSWTPRRTCTASRRRSGSRGRARSTRC